MSKVNLSDYKNLYLKTAKEYVNNMSSGLSKLSANISDKEAINIIHISSHSLKSQSQVMGFTDIANLCLNLEKASNDFLTEVSQINNQFVNVLKKTINELNLKISDIEIKQ